MILDLELAQNVADDGVLEDLLNFGVFHGVGHLHLWFSIQEKALGLATYINV